MWRASREAGPLETPRKEASVWPSVVTGYLGAEGQGSKGWAQQCESEGMAGSGWRVWGSGSGPCSEPHPVDS